MVEHAQIIVVGGEIVEVSILCHRGQGRGMWVLRVDRWCDMGMRQAMSISRILVSPVGGVVV